MALQSSKVAAGIKILADHFNALWADLTTNHDHSSGMGGTVDHADLSESGAMGGVSKAHSDIDTHIEGSGSITDNPGGAQGVHDLASSAYVAGSLNSQLVMQAGSDTTDTFIGEDWGDQVKTVTFPTPFTSVVSIVVCPYDESPAKVSVDNVSTTQFRAKFAFTDVSKGKNQHNTPFYWLAIGTK